MDIKDEKPLLSVIIPAYNEEKTIEETLKKVKEANPQEKEIIVVDDFSTDNTPEILRKFNKSLKIVRHERNKGKGEAIKTGLEYCSGKITLIQDADTEYDPSEYEKLISPILEGEAKIVYGSRFLGNKKHSKTKFYYANKSLSFLTSLVYRRKITDMETCYKAIETDLFKALKPESKGFDIEPEITSKLLKKGYNIQEIPISYFPRTREEGKKIKAKDGIIAVYTLVKYRLRKIN
ncbi:MAG: glycosyltransferase family 2 protein [Minisyncoccales bacterium]